MAAHVAAVDEGFYRRLRAGRHAPAIPTTALPAPVRLVPGGRGPVVHDVPAVASGRMSEAVLAELKARSEKETP